jgi:hypothetical protein
MRTLLTCVAAGLLAAVAPPGAGAQQLLVGGKAGLSVGRASEAISFDRSTDREGFAIYSGSRVGMVAGAAVTIPISPQLSVQPELLWVAQGESIEGTFVTAAGDRSHVDWLRAFDYIQIPVFGRFDLTPAEPVGFFVYAGPFFAFEVACRVDREGPPSATFDIFQTCEDEGRNRTDYGLGAGVGFSFDAGFGQLSLEGRYSAGRKYAGEGRGHVLDTEIGFRMKHRVFGLLAGVAVPIGAPR